MQILITLLSISVFGIGVYIAAIAARANYQGKQGVNLSDRRVEIFHRTFPTTFDNDPALARYIFRMSNVTLTEEISLDERLAQITKIKEMMKNLHNIQPQAINDSHILLRDTARLDLAKFLEFRSTKTEAFTEARFTKRQLADRDHEKIALAGAV